MKRTTLMAATGGAVVVLAATGAALGVAASDATTPARNTSLVAETTTPTHEPDSSTPAATAPAARQVSAEQASKIALGRAGGGRITEIEAEFEHGRPVWKVELINGGVEHEVYVDRETGAVIKAEREAAEVRDRHGDDADGDRHGDDADGDRHGDDADRDRHGDDNSGPGSGDDNSGPGSGDDSDDNSGRDHPEDD